MEIPIRPENKRTLTEKEAQFILEQAIDPDFANYYEGDVESLPQLPKTIGQLVLYEEEHEELPSPEVV